MRFGGILQTAPSCSCMWARRPTERRSTPAALPGLIDRIRTRGSTVSSRSPFTADDGARSQALPVAAPRSRSTRVVKRRSDRLTARLLRGRIVRFGSAPMHAALAAFEAVTSSLSPAAPSPPGPWSMSSPTNGSPGVTVTSARRRFALLLGSALMMGLDNASGSRRRNHRRSEFAQNRPCCVA